MAQIIYSLCFLTALLCAALLIRSYIRNRHRLLFWSAACFVGLSINNLLLVLDQIAFPYIDLAAWRLLAAVVAVSLLLFGLIWEHE